MGLLSDGGVHSHIRHLYGLLELAKRKDFENVFINCFLDGRDTPPASAETYIMKLNEKIQEKGVGKIATISGRFYSMDRDKRWERVKKSYDMLVNGIGNKATSAIAAIENSYQKEVFDEFVEPTIICNEEEPVAKIEKNDSVIFFNFRPDRAREITRTLVDKEFEAFTEDQIKKIEDYMENYQLLNALQEIWAVISRTNKYIDETRPWELEKNGETEKLKSSMYHLIENIRKIGIVLLPFMEETAKNLLHQIGVKEELQTWESLYKYDSLKDTKVIEKGEPLFMRKKLEEELEYLKN